MLERPFLTAHWTELVLLNFIVPAEVLAPLVPRGTELDLFDGQAYISVVAFRFHTVRVLGLSIPGHTSFPEINLRYYVRRTVNDEVRRGVVFVREIVPRRAVAIIANWLYHENYRARPMRNELHSAGPDLGPGDTLEYAWDSGVRRSLRGRLPPQWNRIGGRVAAPLALPPAGSLDEFLVEHYWGYVRAKDGSTREYRVVHDPWLVGPADKIMWDCDPSMTFGSPLAEYLRASPATAIIAAGSPVRVYRGRLI